MSVVCLSLLQRRPRVSLTLEKEKEQEHRESSVPCDVNVAKARICCPTDPSLKTVVMVQVPWNQATNSGFYESIGSLLEREVFPVARAIRLPITRNAVAVWLNCSSDDAAEI